MTVIDGKRILVVEDEYLTAADLKRNLSNRGADVVGPVAMLAQGLALAENERLDAAVLDINPEGDASFPIADLLTERQVPFVFMTGYDAWALPEQYACRPTVAKPYQVATLVKAVEAFWPAETSA